MLNPTLINCLLHSIYFKKQQNNINIGLFEGEKAFRIMSNITKERLESVIPRLDKIADLRDELRDCVSPSDIKNQQRLWILEHQGNLDHKLALKCRELENELEMLPVFSDRYEKFMDWADKLEKRLDILQASSKKYFTPVITDAIPMLEADLFNEMDMKEKEVKWIDKVGQALVVSSQGAQERNGVKIQDSTLKISQRWDKLKDLWEQKVAKMHEDRMKAKHLNNELMDLKDWIKDREKLLTKPVSILNTSTEEYEKKRQEYEECQKEIQSKSEEVGKLFKSCDSFLEMACNAHCNFDSIRNALENVQKRWENITNKCDIRIQDSDDLHRDWTKFNADLDRLMRWIKESKVKISDIDVLASKVSFGELKCVEKDLVKLKYEMLHEKIQDLESLSVDYYKLAQDLRLDASNDLMTKFIQVNHEWEDLSRHLDVILKRIRHSKQILGNFKTLRDQEMTFLRKFDAQLTEVEFSSGLDELQKKNLLSEMQNEFHQRELQYLDKVAEFGLHLLQRSELKDAEMIEKSLQDFNQLKDDIAVRLNSLVIAFNPPDFELQTLDTDMTDPLPQISVNNSIHADVLKFEKCCSDPKESFLTRSVCSMPDSGICMMSTGADVSPPDLARGDTPVSEGIGMSLTPNSEGQNVPLSRKSDDDIRFACETLVPEVLEDSMNSDYAFEPNLQQNLDELCGEMTKLETILTQDSEDNQVSYQLLTRLYASCRSKMDLVVHYQQRREDFGRSDDETEADGEVSKRIDESRTKLQRLERILRSKQDERQKWDRLEQDLWNTEIWLGHAQEFLGKNGTAAIVPTEMESLEESVRVCRDFMKGLDSYKSVMLSLNVMGDHIIQNSQGGGGIVALENRLIAINSELEETCENATCWQIKLQAALLENSEFNHTIEDLNQWLEEIMKSVQSSEPVDLAAEKAILDSKKQRFQEIHLDLQKCQPRIGFLQDAIEEFWTEESELDCSAVKKKLVSMSQKLQILLNICLIYSTKLNLSEDFSLTEDCDVVSSSMILPILTKELLGFQGKKEISSEPKEEFLSASSQHPLTHYSENGTNFTIWQERRNFFARMLRAAVPIQVVLLVLLVVCFIAPLDQGETRCSARNSVRSWFDPVVEWSNGPPPI